MPNQPKYRMTLSLSVLNHLGVNLYSNIPAVMSEVVANAWDADAENVKIEIDLESKEIIIVDDGCGMSLDDINDKFLLVGYNRRGSHSGGDVETAKGRKPMGRKGIGKLSLFSIARKIEIHSKKDGVCNAFLLDGEEIKALLSAETSTTSEYNPQPIEPDFQGEKGTRIVIRKLKKNISQRTPDYFRQRLARRFALYDQAGGMESFFVFVNGKKISINDRNYFHKLEYLFQFEKNYGEYCDERVEVENRLFRFNERGEPSETGEYAVHGWIGLARSSSDLKESQDNINNLAIFARNKLAQENILDDFDFGGFFTRYVVGEIYADFLDQDGEEDIATSSRQRIMEDSPRFIALREFLKKELWHVSIMRDKHKAASAVRDACELIPEIEEWLENLSPSLQKAAEKLLMQINKIQTDESHRAQLFVYGIQAFHSLRARDLLASLEKITPQNLSAFLQAVAEFDDLEESHYYEIIHGRLLVIEKVRVDVANDQYENILRDYLANHLWLLDPSWDPVISQPTVERRVDQEFGALNVHLSKDERNGRVDIMYRKAGGVHVIIELKRPSVVPKRTDLIDQVNKYRSALKKCLKQAGEPHPLVQVICLVGKDLQGWGDEEVRVDEMRFLEQEKIRVLNYLEMLSDAERMYRKYLEAKAEAGKIQKLLNKIRDRVPSSDSASD